MNPVGTRVAPPREDDFAKACRRHERIAAFLQSYEGERLTTEQICDGLRIEYASPEHGSLIWMLAKMLEYQQVSHDYKDCESVWWVEPRRSAEEPAFNLRHVKAVTRSKDFG